jgi:hypothetical protein
MTKSAVFCVVVFGLAAVANAGVIPVINTGGSDGYFDFTEQLNQTVDYKTVNGVAYDRYSLYCTGFLPDPVTGVTPTYIVACDGTWTFPGGITMPSQNAIDAFDANYPGYTWPTWTVSAAPSLAGQGDYDGAPLSVLKFSSLVLGATWSRNQAGSDDELYSSMQGTWYSSGEGSEPAPFLIGTFYAPTGNTPAPGTVLFSGAFGFEGGGDGFSNNAEIEVAPSPEPATLVLLGSGLIALFAAIGQGRGAKELFFRLLYIALSLFSFGRRIGLFDLGVVTANP